MFMYVTFARLQLLGAGAKDIQQAMNVVESELRADAQFQVGLDQECYWIYLYYLCTVFSIQGSYSRGGVFFSLILFKFNSYVFKYEMSLKWLHFKLDDISKQFYWFNSRY